MAAAIPSDLPEPHLEVLEEILPPSPQAGDGEEYVDLNKLEVASPEAPAASTATAPAAPETQDGAGDSATPEEDEEDIPSEWRGKSRKDLAKMLRDSQQLIGRQGSELGELRKRTDMAIQASLAALNQRKQEQQPPQPAAPAAPKGIEDETEFFRSPKQAVAAEVAAAIAASPEIEKIKQMFGEQAKAQAIERAQRNTERFNAAHPDAAQIMQEPEFRQWVEASRYRTQLLSNAHHRYDYEAGDELFSTYKALKNVGKAAAAPAATGGAAQPATVSEAARTMAAAAAAKRKQALNDAAAPTGGNAAPAQSGSKKIYRRADVLDLMENNPDRYERLAPEIALAYAEGRVR